MKMFTLVCIIAASAIASAQTEPVKATTETALAAPAPQKVKKPAKKMKKAAAKPAAQNTEAKSMEVAAAPTPEMTSAAGTSVAAAPAAPAAKKALGGYIISDTMSDHMNTKAIQSITTIGASYQLGDLTKVSIGQAFESASDEMYAAISDQLDKNNFRAMYVEPIINTVVMGFLGTDKTKFDFRMRLNNNSALWNEYGGAAGIDRHYQLSTSSSLALTPQLAATLYNEARVYQYTDNSPVGTRLSVLPGLGYAITETFSVYQIAGYIVNTKDGEALTNKRERMYLETGLNYAPAAVEGLNINLLVFQDKMTATQAPGEKVSSFSLYDVNNNTDGTISNDGVVYEAIINYTF